MVSARYLESERSKAVMSWMCFVAPEMIVRRSPGSFFMRVLYSLFVRVIELSLGMFESTATGSAP